MYHVTEGKREKTLFLTENIRKSSSEDCSDLNNMWTQASLTYFKTLIQYILYFFSVVWEPECGGWNNCKIGNSASPILNFFETTPLYLWYKLAFSERRQLPKSASVIDSAQRILLCCAFSYLLESHSRYKKKGQHPTLRNTTNQTLTSPADFERRAITLLWQVFLFSK